MYSRFSNYSVENSRVCSIRAAFQILTFRDPVTGYNLTIEGYENRFFKGLFSKRGSFAGCVKCS